MNSWVENSLRRQDRGAGVALRDEAAEKTEAAEYAENEMRSAVGKRAEDCGKRKIGQRFAGILLVAGVLFMILWIQPFSHQNSERMEKTENQKQDITGILQKKSLRQRDYETLFFQTGLGKAAVQQLAGKEILQFQNFFFKEHGWECTRECFTRHDKILLEENETVPLAPVEDGDIFISFSSHTLGWRHGHAGLVVDAELGLCLEAVMPGCASEIKSLEHWKNGSNFILLRLKEASKKERKEIAAFARRNLQDVPYGLLSGIFDRREEEKCEELTAQCAYLIWYAFMQFGYDLDGDGGRLVTVEDLLKSPCLDIVQVAGINPKTIEMRR